ncbi:hypothetical protein JTB14_021727 [Gonioctena quinquepunctata]|nr:hypothetical protein JTB14_021727 [Gonioctena quinquepunctata]
MKYLRYIVDRNGLHVDSEKVKSILALSTPTNVLEENQRVFGVAPILSCIDYSTPFVVQSDTSGYGIGAALTQPHASGEKVISHLSRSLTRQEMNFTTERKCLAVLWLIEKLQPYLEVVHRKGKEYVVPDTLSRCVPVIDEVEVAVKEPLELKNNEADKWYNRVKARVIENPLEFKRSE